MAALGFVSGGSTTIRSKQKGFPHVCVRTRENSRARTGRVLCSPQTDLRIRTAADKDVEVMIQIYEDAFLSLDAGNVFSRIDSFWKSRRIKAQMIEMFANIKDTDDEHMNKVFLAESEGSGEVLGFVQLMNMPCPIPVNRSPAPLRPYIGNLSVLSRFRRRGVASALVSRCETFAQELGYGEIFLHVEQGNDPARILYRKLGYSAELVDPEYYTARGKPRRIYLRKVFPVEERPSPQDESAEPVPVEERPSPHDESAEPV